MVSEQQGFIPPPPVQVGLAAGSRVILTTDINYLDKEPLKQGMQGSLIRIDQTGDALVDFDDLGLRRWVLACDLDKLQLQGVTPQALAQMVGSPASSFSTADNFSPGSAGFAPGSFNTSAPGSFNMNLPGVAPRVGSFPGAAPRVGSFFGAIPESSSMIIRPEVVRGDVMRPDFVPPTGVPTTFDDSGVRRNGVPPNFLDGQGISSPRRSVVERFQWS